MLHRKTALTLALSVALALPASGAVIYNNLTPNNLMAMATRPDSPGAFEIETADDFTLGIRSFVTSATFTGVLVPSVSGGSTSISDVAVEMYRVFPADSDTSRTPNVPTRANSPSDVAFATRDSAAFELNFQAILLAPTFTAANSVAPGGIHASPNQQTLGNGPVTGQEVQITVNFATPFDLPADHYFFVPQITLNGGTFYWLSASRPIAGPGTTPFNPDLQVWTRDANLNPDWLRAGTDIVGGTTFDAAFSLDGIAIPEPPGIVPMLLGAGLIAVFRKRIAERPR